ncbi:MAG: zf-HC2 protein [Bacteroidetes bacterium]|nr:zf-HC2 protein [Bacteroidota bacterium]
MKCDEYQEQLSALIDNELADQESELLFTHLSECAACRATLRSELELRANLKEDVPPLAPRELDEKVLSTMSKAEGQLDARRVMRRGVWQRNVSMRWPLAAAIAGLFLIGGLAVTSVWSPCNKPAEPQVRIVYITALPIVEVHGYFP